MGALALPACPGLAWLAWPARARAAEPEDPPPAYNGRGMTAANQGLGRSGIWNRDETRTGPETAGRNDPRRSTWNSRPPISVAAAR